MLIICFFGGGSLIEPFGLLLNLIGNDRFQDNVDSYIEGGAYGFSFGYFERTFFFILVTYNIEKLLKQRKSNIVFYNLFFFYYVFFHILSPISGVIMKRLSFIFICSYWVLIPNLLVALRDKYHILVLYFFIISLLKISSNNTLLMKYDNLLFGIETYEHKRDNAYRTMMNTNN